MGCVCSRGFPEDVPPTPGALAAAYDSRRGRYGPGDFDSGELAIPPPKPPHSHKVSDTGTFLGRASIAGLEKAVEVLDTLSSSMTNLNPGSGFLSGGTNRGNKACILAFEVANTIAKASSLWWSCSDESIEELKKEILHSDGVRILVSSNTIELLHIAHKREELAIFSREVIRFGNLCKDPIWHNLGRYFDKYASEKLVIDNTPQDHSKESMEATVQKMINLAQNTSELYHEMHALDRFEQDFKRKFHEEESVPAARRESIMILHSELKRQRKLVKNLKKKSLWSSTLEDIVEKLVDIVIFLHKQIRDSFNEAGTEFCASEQTPNKRLGSCGLALHYANVINQIENIVSRLLSLPPSARDNLYHGLPITVKSALRSRLQTYNTEEERSVAQIKAEMQKTLRWLLPVAENTLRAHQGFGWVGEWANLGSDMSKKSGSQHSVIRVQTHHHVDKAKTEHYHLLREIDENSPLHISHNRPRRLLFTALRFCIDVQHPNGHSISTPFQGLPASTGNRKKRPLPHLPWRPLPRLPPASAPSRLPPPAPPPCLPLSTAAPARAAHEADPNPSATPASLRRAPSSSAPPPLTTYPRPRPQKRTPVRLRTPQTPHAPSPVAQAHHPPRRHHSWIRPNLHGRRLLRSNLLRHPTFDRLRTRLHRHPIQHAAENRHCSSHPVQSVVHIVDAHHVFTEIASRNPHTTYMLYLLLPLHGLLFQLISSAH